jgi:hypothetical protein
LLRSELDQQRELLLLCLHRVDPVLIADFIELDMERDDLCLDLRVDFAIVQSVLPIRDPSDGSGSS